MSPEEKAEVREVCKRISEEQDPVEFQRSEQSRRVQYSTPILWPERNAKCCTIPVLPKKSEKCHCILESCFVDYPAIKFYRGLPSSPSFAKKEKNL
jgi:hypothetical protein